MFHKRYKLTNHYGYEVKVHYFNEGKVEIWDASGSTMLASVRSVKKDEEWGLVVSDSRVKNVKGIGVIYKSGQAAEALEQALNFAFEQAQDLWEEHLNKCRLEKVFKERKV